MELLFLAFVLVVVACVAPQCVPGHLQDVVRIAALGLALFCEVVQGRRGKRSRWQYSGAGAARQAL